MKSFYQKGKASVIIDGQYGSTGKGLLAGYMARHSEMPLGHVVHTTNAAPNAGHTTEWWDGPTPTITSGPMIGTTTRESKRLVTYHLPTGGVLRHELCYINAGAVIDVDMLMREITDAAGVMGHLPMVQVHPNAAMLLVDDKVAEADEASAATAISSTRKGVGAAIARKVRREALTIKDYKRFYPDASIRLNLLELGRVTRFGQSVSIEVPQGISLGLNHSGFYPYCTSREVSVAQAMSDAGIHPADLGLVALSMRTFPIRVGSLPGQTSGGYFFDQKEIEWSSLGLEPELTTVTRRPRRLFTWSREQYRQALWKSRPAVVFLNFVNYFKSVRQFQDHMTNMWEDHDLTGIKPSVIFGFGPRIEDVIDGGALEAEAYLNDLLTDRKEA
jgi:adenylosuccinate synthase